MVDEIMDISVDVLNSISLKEAFQKLFQPGILDGNNKYKCDNCKKLVAARKQICILNTKLAIAGSVTHNVIRDLFGVKLDMTKYAEQEIRKLKRQIDDLREERDRCISQIYRKEEDILAGKMSMALIASSVSKGDYRSMKDITYFVLTIGFVMGVTLVAILGVSFGSIVTLQPLNALAFIVDGLHYGVSDFPYVAYSMMLVGILSSAFLFYAPSGFGLHGVWSGLTLFMGLRKLAGRIR
ncbi:unnamed protein product [Lactuca saligna]|uniref:Uncharacterized protein n=1 Tax=Lactuca saligna TaxID=75948 RepID=A0AA35YXG1_LACSI|nr:unnamed protein product [Lactuca saligna]